MAFYSDLQPIKESPPSLSSSSSKTFHDLPEGWLGESVYMAVPYDRLVFGVETDLPILTTVPGGGGGESTGGQRGDL